MAKYYLTAHDVTRGCSHPMININYSTQHNPPVASINHMSELLVMFIVSVFFCSCSVTQTSLFLLPATDTNCNNDSPHLFWVLVDSVCLYCCLHESSSEALGIIREHFPTGSSTLNRSNNTHFSHSVDTAYTEL